MLLPAIMELLKIITAYNKILIVSEENQVVRMWSFIELENRTFTPSKSWN